MKVRTAKLRGLAAAAALILGTAVFGGAALASDTEEEAVTEAITEAATEAVAETAGEAAEGTHVVVDHNGNEVEVPNNAQRIVVCDIYPLPSVLTVFFDSAEKIVGMAPPSMTAAQNGLLGQLYPEVLDAETGFIEGSELNMEELLKLEPDVVFYSASQPAQGEQLANAGLAAVAVSVNKWQYNCIETLNNWIALLGEIFPENEKTQIVEDYSNKVYDMVQERVANIPDEERERAFVLFQYNDTTLLTSGKQFFGQWWADAIGAVNVAEELEKDNSVAVNMEQIYAWNPSLIFITNFNTYGPEDLYNNTVEGYDWSPIDAIVNQRAYKMPLGMYRSYTPGADTPVTLLWMAKTAYPDLFEDIDIIEEAKTYYNEVFGIELTDEQAGSIFTPVEAAGTGFAYNN